MDLLNAIRCFIKVVEAGSIAAGARNLGLTPAAVSQNLARLESHLQVRLLTRTTRSMSLTPAQATSTTNVSVISNVILPKPSRPSPPQTVNPKADCALLRPRRSVAM